MAGSTPLIHACVLLYQADLWVLDAMLGPLGVRWNDRSLLCGSLDLAMWFHLPPRCDVWTLYDLRSPVMDGSRGFTEGRMYQEGVIVATMMQEGIVRPRRAPAAD
jgi:acyl-CoA thioesterase-2